MMTKDEAIDLIDNLLQARIDYERATSARVEKARAEYHAARERVIAAFDSMKERQIKHMVNRFLCWKLPKNFRPDGGISFDRFSVGWPHQYRNEPSGTNLLDATQADAMVRYLIEEMPQ